MGNFYSVSAYGPGGESAQCTAVFATMDRRELILERLEAIAGAIPGVVLAGRNVIDPSDNQLPAIIVLEGDEETDERDLEEGRGGTTTVREHMTPHMVITAMTPPGEVVTQTDGTIAWDDKLGMALNGLRPAVIKAVLNDGPLAALYGSNGRVIYRGMVSDLQAGRSVIGRFAVAFQVTYPLIASQL